jgi:hypothetical protein
MRKIAIMLAASTALVFGAAPTWQAFAQIERGPAALAAAPKNFTPIEKAACGPHWGAHCGPWHHWVCGRYHCWCAPC